MILTLHDAYTLGWIGGHIQAELDHPDQANDITWMTAAVDAINHMGNLNSSTPLPNIKKAWHIGYRHGIQRRPLVDTIDIAALRAQNNITQAQLAQMLGVQVMQISRWENWKVLPDKQTVIKLKKLLPIS